MDGYDLYKQAFLLLRSMCIITHDTWEMELDSVKAVFTPAGKEGGFLAGIETY